MKEFYEKVQQWLNTDASKRSNAEGAMLLLQINRNRIMYSNIMNNPDGKADIIEYNLRKHLNFHLQSITHQEVEKMAKKAEKIAVVHSLAEDKSETNSGIGKGRRSDHDSIPAEIQALYAENLSILRRMREVHLNLRKMSEMSNAGKACSDSDRYPYLKELISLDKRYHSNWDTYDHYVPENASAPVVSAAIQKEDVIQESKAATRRVNLAKTRYKNNPSAELKKKILEDYSKIISPTDKLISELKKLGILS